MISQGVVLAFAQRAGSATAASPSRLEAVSEQPVPGAGCCAKPTIDVKYALQSAVL